MIEKNPDKMSEREMRGEIKILRKLREAQATMVSNLRGEIEKMKEIDDALRDFNYEKAKKLFEDFAREGFDEVVASRPLKRKFTA